MEDLVGKENKAFGLVVAVAYDRYREQQDEYSETGSETSFTDKGRFRY